MQAAKIFWQQGPFEGEGSNWPRNTLPRFNREAQELEFHGFGGSNGSMNLGNVHVVHTQAPSTVFPGKTVTLVRSSCWLNPHCRVEWIPADWDRIDIYLHHGYQDGFNMHRSNTMFL